MIGVIAVLLLGLEVLGIIRLLVMPGPPDLRVPDTIGGLPRTATADPVVKVVEQGFRQQPGVEQTAVEAYGTGGPSAVIMAAASGRIKARGDFFDNEERGLSALGPGAGRQTRDVGGIRMTCETFQPASGQPGVTLCAATPRLLIFEIVARGRDIDDTASLTAVAYGDAVTPGGASPGVGATVLFVVIAFDVLIAVIATREARGFQRRHGRPPWGWPPMVWSLVSLCSLLVGAVLIAIARKTDRVAVAAGRPWSGYGPPPPGYVPAPTPWAPPSPGWPAPPVGTWVPARPVERERVIRPSLLVALIVIGSLIGLAIALAIIGALINAAS